MTPHENNFLLHAQVCLDEVKNCICEINFNGFSFTVMS
jgi:hypothetical protein